MDKKQNNISASANIECLATAWKTPNISHALHGIVPPIVTPLTNELKLDYKALERLLNRVMVPGINGIFILGTTGEAPSLSPEVKLELIRLTCDFASGRIPVLVGITDPALEVSLELAGAAKQFGAAALVAAPPFYYQITQDELIAYYLNLVSKVELPLYLYNMPPLTKITIKPKTVRILATNPKICGLKDSSGDIKYLTEVLEVKKLRPDWSILIGPEDLLHHGLELGADGGVNGGAQILPEIFGTFYNAFRAGNKQLVCELNLKIQKLQKIYGEPPEPAGVVKSIKAALEILGICSSNVMPPLAHPDEQLKNLVREVLKELGLIS